MLIDYFFQIFSQTCIQLIPWIPGIIVIYILFGLISGLLLKER